MVEKNNFEILVWIFVLVKILDDMKVLLLLYYPSSSSSIMLYIRLSYSCLKLFSNKG